jgi:hypothetical protein
MMANIMKRRKSGHTFTDVVDKDGIYVYRVEIDMI